MIHLNESGIVVLEGDSLDLLRATPADTFDSIVTDPPYGLEFMGKAWDKALPPIEIWREALRTAKPGAHLVAFGAPRLYHRLACQIEDAGWVLRDCLMWLYGSGFPKSKNVALAIDKGEGFSNRGRAIPTASTKQAGPGAAPLTGNPVPPYEARSDAGARWDGWGTALKPAWEPILLARKPLIGTVAANVLEHGTGGINVDGCRIGTEEPPGRWPANLILDESGEEWRRYFYCAKASRAEREAGLEAFEPAHMDPNRKDGSKGRESPRAGAGRSGERKNNHPTVKPLSLIRWLTRLVTPPGGLVCDPFLGSGTGGIAARAEGFRHLGIERDPRFAEIAAARIKNWRKS